MDADKIMILVLALALLISGTLVIILARSRQSARDTLFATQAGFAARLCNERREWYDAGRRQAEREAGESFRRGLAQGEQKAIQALLADIRDDSQWN